jgi:hypothetical protein
MTAGNFPPDLVEATQNVIFANSGIIAGVVRRSDGIVASSGTVRLTGGNFNSPISTNIAPDGSYRFTGVPAGTYSLLAMVSHPQGTALNGNTTTLVIEGQTITADIQLQPTGGVTGIVRRANNDAVVNLLVQLRAANFLRSATTDTSGRFTFTDVPVGAVTIEAFEQVTNTAASVRVEVATDQTLTQDMMLGSGGTVTGLVTNANNQSVSGAQVTMQTSSGTFTGMTDAQGRYRFERVTLGNVAVAVNDPVSRLRGRTSGSVGLSGEVLTLNVRLSASGTVTGIVHRADGTTPLASADVTLYTRFFNSTIGRTTTDAEGRYTIDYVPVGEFVVDVNELATGDRGRVTNQVFANGETRTVNVTMNGLGRITVTVRDAGGAPAPGAGVTLTSGTQFGGNQQGTTQADGTVVFERVLAGNFSVIARAATTNLGGSASGSVAAGAESTVTVNLQPSGVITGRALAPDGVTPISGATVRLHNNANYYSVIQQATTAGDGSYRFDAIPLGIYILDALDSTGRLRAKANTVTLSSNGEIVTANMTFVGLGTVTGRVLNPNGTAAPSIRVDLRSANSVIGGSFSATTNNLGTYTIGGVPTGNFTVTARDTGRQLQGEIGGQLTQHGQTVTVDIQLISNAITLPVTRRDANAFSFDFYPNGSIQNGLNGIYSGDASGNSGSYFLDIIANGTANRFTGGTIGTVEDSNREIAVREQNLAGLDVMRKMFVPTNGYFVRYLEILSNPTAEPITVDVRLESNLYYRDSWWTGTTVTTVTGTSSGDATLDVSDGTNPDRWVVVDDPTDADPFISGGVPSTAFVFDGAGAATRTGTATYGSGFTTRLSNQWNSVTIQPGETITLMHFGAQQTTRAAATASAERLSQLPPEALAGLSAEEIAQIRNFVVPADGVSTVAALPALTGTISGRVLEGNRITGVGSAQVRFRSNTPVFNRTFTATSAADGSFGYVSTFDDNGNILSIPIAPFTLESTHPITGIQASASTGTFPCRRDSGDC